MKNLIFTVFVLVCLQVNATSHNVPNKCDKRVEVFNIFNYPTPKDYLIASLPSIIETLKAIESRNDVSAIGDSGKAFGILQIHNVYVQEVNYRYKTNYTHKQMFEERLAEEVTKLYLTFFIERYFKKHGKFPTEKRIVQTHNFGMYQLTYDNGYYKKYLKESNIKTV